MATDPPRMHNGIMIFIPTSGANVVQGSPGIPAIFIPAAETVQYIQHASQPLRSNQFQQHRPLRTLEKFLKAETKALAAVQIMIGLIHIGFGSVAALLASTPYISVSTLGGYPFWGGLFFIASGSIAVVAEKKMDNYLVKCSVGLNLTSAVMAFIGTILLITQLAINNPYEYYYASFIVHRIGTGLCVVLLLFTLLEFCIVVSAVCFRCQEACFSDDVAMAFVPYTVIGNGVTPTENNPPPPAYDQAVLSPNVQA